MWMDFYSLFGTEAHWLYRMVLVVGDCTSLGTIYHRLFDYLCGFHWIRGQPISKMKTETHYVSHCIVSSNPTGKGKRITSLTLSKDWMILDIFYDSIRQEFNLVVLDSLEIDSGNFVLVDFYVYANGERFEDNLTHCKTVNIEKSENPPVYRSLFFA